jgi:hypothetical protein
VNSHFLQNLLRTRISSTAAAWSSRSLRSCHTAFVVRVGQQEYERERISGARLRRPATFGGFTSWRPSLIHSFLLPSLITLFSTLIPFVAGSPLLMLLFGAGSSCRMFVLGLFLSCISRLLSGSEFPRIKVFRKQHCAANDGDTSSR